MTHPTLDEAIQTTAAAERNLADLPQVEIDRREARAALERRAEPCSFGPAAEPWGCRVHVNGYRTSLEQTECSTVRRVAMQARLEAKDAVVEAAVAWSEHPTPANIGALHAAVDRYREHAAEGA